MRNKAILLISSIALLSSQAIAQEGDRKWLPLRSDLAGPKFYVTSVIDPDTELAIASGRVDHKSAREWCDAKGSGEDCVERVLSERKAKEARATADCSAGSIYATDVKQYGIDGSDGQAIRWKDANGNEVEPTSEWGLALTQQWNILCPSGRKAEQVRPRVAAAPKAADADRIIPGRSATQDQVEAVETKASPIRPAQAPAARGVPSSARSFVDPSELNGSVYDHNGSMMRIDVEQGIIVYEDPKPSIANVAQPGTVLFRGQIGYPRPGLKIIGTAYAFKSGCTPAAYPVTGRYSSDNSEIILQGEGPTWNGCSYTLTKRSKHSTLRFRSMISP